MFTVALFMVAKGYSNRYTYHLKKEKLWYSHTKSKYWSMLQYGWTLKTLGKMKGVDNKGHLFYDSMECLKLHRDRESRLVIAKGWG